MSDDESAIIDQICDEFEAAIRRDPDSPPSIATYLQRVAAPTRPELIVELLGLEWELINPDDRKRRLSALRQSHPQWQELIEKFQASQSDDEVPITDFDGRLDDQIGPYRLIRLIGEGGMGSVYMAQQVAPVKRVVALKLVKSGLDSKQVIARFEAERQALALMDHPSIARILDAGTTESGQPYFVMEFVEGLPLVEYCDQKRLDIESRMQVFSQICEGVHHAHQKGVIHRDLKPANILVAEYDGKPQPKIIDFGLAKAIGVSQRLTDATLATEFGQILGTLKYMSPEQAGFESGTADSRSDIYTLGVILFELLTGSTPLDESSIRGQPILSVLKELREQDTPRPSSVLTNSNDCLKEMASRRQSDVRKMITLLSGELDWIVLKAMEKEPGRRYESSLALHSDIQNLIQHQPVSARPPSRVYRIRKAFQRNRTLVVNAFVAVAILAVVSVAAIVIAGKRIESNTAIRWVESLATIDISKVDGVSQKIIEHPEYALPALVQQFESSPEESREKLHSALALLPHDASVADYLSDRLLSTQPQQFGIVLDALRPGSDATKQEYWRVAKDNQENESARFRACCALASIDQSNPDWQEGQLQRWLIEQFLKLEGTDKRCFQVALKPVGPKLVKTLNLFLGDQSCSDAQRSAMVQTLMDWAPDHPEALFSSLTACHDGQFEPLFRSLIPYRDVAVGLAETQLSKASVVEPAEEFDEPTIRKHRNAAVLLYRLQDADKFWPLLEHSPDPTLRTELFLSLAKMNAEPDLLFERYEVENTASIKHAIVVALGQFEISKMELDQRSEFVDVLLADFKSHPDAGLHSATSWLLKRWGHEKSFEEIEQQLAAPFDDTRGEAANSKSWFVNSQGQTYSVVDAGTFIMGMPESHEKFRSNTPQINVALNRQFAICCTEVTDRQFERFRQTHPQPSEEHEASAANWISWYEAAKYCNWLSDQEGIPKSEWCYVPNGQGEFGDGMSAKPKFWELKGYRLPTEAEWEFACRSNTTTHTFFGEPNKHVLQFAWLDRNSANEIHRVGQLIPNEFGLFDTYGNVAEWCFDRFSGYQENVQPITSPVDGSSLRIFRGSTFRHLAAASPFRTASTPVNPYLPSLGLRPVRSIISDRVAQNSNAILAKMKEDYLNVKLKDALDDEKKLVELKKIIHQWKQIARSSQLVSFLTDEYESLNSDQVKEQLLWDVHHASVAIYRSGDATLSREINSKFLNFAKTDFGTDSEIKVTYLTHLAYLGIVEGNYETALKHYQSVLESKKRTYGKTHEYTFFAKSNVANSFKYCGDSESANRILMDAIATAIQESGEGSLKDAIRQMKLCVTMIENVEGLDCKTAWYCMSYLGGAYFQDDQPTEALLQFQKIFKSKKSVLGLTHEETHVTRINLLGAYRRAEKLSEAADWLATVIKDLERDESDVAKMQANFARVELVELLIDLQKFDMAQKQVDLLKASTKETQPDQEWIAGDLQAVDGWLRFKMGENTGVQSLLVSGLDGLIKDQSQIPERIQSERPLKAAQRLVEFGKTLDRPELLSQWQKKLKRVTGNQ